jgi:uncharacterized protein
VTKPVRRPWGLVLWVATACALLWFAPRPPEPGPMKEEERAAMQRATELVVRDVQQWQAELGDLSLPWDEARGHLAIVIDDVGRELHLLDKLLSLRFHVTFAILPGARYAAGAQLRLLEDRRRYREILLHLPMEPLDGARMHEGDEAAEAFLLRTDEPAAVRAKVEAALQRVPAAIGVNNHMGSAFTSDRAGMDTVVEVLAERGLFLLDSRTTADTQAEAAARSAGLPVVVRHVFLDNEVTEPAIERALDEAVERARFEPTVAIAHPSVEVHAVLERRLEALHAEGIAVYPLSWLLRPEARR